MPNIQVFDITFGFYANFYKNIRLLDSISHDPIIVHMHSIGGNWNDGMAIYDSMLVAQSPDIILLDEPVAGLTDEETNKTAELIKSLAGEHTVVVIEHDMEFIRDLAAPVTVLHQGQLLTEGSLDEVKSDPKVIEVYLGQSE